MNIWIINGPNLNLLGLREPEIYGSKTLNDLENFIKKEADSLKISTTFLQSNHEGELVDWIQQSLGRADGIIINPAAYTHTSIAILDALKAVNLPAVEVHLSKVDQREPFRSVSYSSLACNKVISGKGFGGYREALHFLSEFLSEPSKNDPQTNRGVSHSSSARATSTQEKIDE